MRILRACGLLVLATAACSDSTDISKFVYGAGQPGAMLPEGGEIRHENVRILGMPVQTWLMVYQYTAPASVATAPFADATNSAMNGNGMFGNCVDERTGSPTWPFHPITGAMYMSLPAGFPKISGPGFAAPTTIPLTADAENRVGNSTFRKYDLTYGGGTPGAPPAGFNGTLTPAQSQPDSDYMIDIGQGPLTYHMPAAFTAPLGIGGADVVKIPAGQGSGVHVDRAAQRHGRERHDAQHPHVLQLHVLRRSDKRRTRRSSSASPTRTATSSFPRPSSTRCPRRA